MFLIFFLFLDEQDLVEFQLPEHNEEILEISKNEVRSIPIFLDQLKVIIFITLILLFFYNYFQMKRVHLQLEMMEKQLQSLENIITAYTQR